MRTNKRGVNAASRTPLILHGESAVEIHRVTGAELGLLRVLFLEQIAHIVQQLQVRLFRVLSQSRDQTPGQGARAAKALLIGIGRGLRVLASVNA